MPDHKLDEIQQHSTQANQTRAVVKYWLSVDPTPSWRRLVQALEYSEEHQTADKVKLCVEPLTGEHCIATVGINVDKVTNDGSMINSCNPHRKGLVCKNDIKIAYGFSNPIENDFR